MQNPEVTKEDLKKIEKSMRDPKFNNILYEYMLEVSDPKNKHENDLYLLQLAKNGELPENLKLIKPRKFFCIESKIASETDYNFCQVIFVNICLNEEILKAESRYCKESRGENWKVPYSVGKQRYDQILKDEDFEGFKKNKKNGKNLDEKKFDGELGKKNLDEKKFEGELGKKNLDDKLKEFLNDNIKEIPNENINKKNLDEKNLEEKNLEEKNLDEKTNENLDDNKCIVSVIDIVFNPNIKTLCLKNPSFKKMICDISIDGVQKVFSSKKEKIDKDYKIVSSFDCKGETPSIMPILKNEGDLKKESSKIREKTKLYHDIQNMKEENKKNEIKEKNKKIKKNLQNEKKQNEVLHLKMGSINQIELNLVPEYKMVYSYDTESSDFYDEKFKNCKKATKLILKIKLPKVKKLKNLKCDVKNKILVLEYLDLYFLNLNLPNNVKEESYKARFDRKKGVLVLDFVLGKNEKNGKIGNLEEIEKNGKIGNLEEIEKIEKIEKNGNLGEIEKNEKNGNLGEIEKNEKNGNLGEIEKIEKNGNLGEIEKSEKLKKNKILKKIEKNENEENLDKEENLDNQKNLDNEENLEIKELEKIKKTKKEEKLQKTEKTQNSEYLENQKSLKLFNYQKIENTHYFLFNITYSKKSEIEIFKNQNHEILIKKKKTSEYFLLKISKNYEKLQIKFSKNFISLIFITKNQEENFTYKIEKKKNYENYLIKQNFEIFQNEKNHVVPPLKNHVLPPMDFGKIEKFVKKCEIEKLTDEEEYDEDDYKTDKKELDYNFVDLHINKDIWEIF